MSILYSDPESVWQKADEILLPNLQLIAQNHLKMSHVLFECNVYVSWQFHILKHSLQFTGEPRTALRLGTEQMMITFEVSILEN